ncbi:helicase associated domain-containing protein [Streptomyces sp. NPDC056323]|uniref:helicase associated domain-containing protein n=1 Tax=Streptomyces sp. NPDC056323 TaxID=3345784 RepID=UPI0035DBBA87
MAGGIGTGRAREVQAAAVLRFSEARDPAVLARFVRLRVIDPEGAYWRRGVEAAGRWLRETGHSVLRVPYTVVTPEDWGGVGGYPLGQWIADQRRTYVAGTLEAGRVVKLEKLGMVWSEQDAAWADGIAIVKEYAASHGHFLPPTTAVWEGHPIGVWAKNAKAAARPVAAGRPRLVHHRQPCGGGRRHPGHLNGRSLDRTHSTATTGWPASRASPSLTSYGHRRPPSSTAHQAGRTRQSVRSTQTLATYPAPQGLEATDAWPTGAQSPRTMRCGSLGSSGLSTAWIRCWPVPLVQRLERVPLPDETVQSPGAAWAAGAMASTRPAVAAAKATAPVTRLREGDFMNMGTPSSDDDA